MCPILLVVSISIPAPQFFNLFMDNKYNNASNAFFFGLTKGVASFVQSDGGSPGSPEMSFLYELEVGISEFVQNMINDLLYTTYYTTTTTTTY